MKPTTSYSQDFPSVIANATERASTLAGGAGKLASELPNIGNLIKQRAYDAYNQNQDIIQPLDEATGKYLTTPQVAREKYSGIFDPFARERLIAQSVSNASLPMLSLSSILGNRIGRISDIIGGGTDAFKSQVLAEQAQAEQAQQLVETLLKQYQVESDNIFKERELAARASADSGMNGFMQDVYSILNGYQDEEPVVYGPPSPPVNPAAFDDRPKSTPKATTASAPLTTNQPSLWDNIMGFFGAQPKQSWNQPTSLGTSLGGSQPLLLGNMPLSAAYGQTGSNTLSMRR